MDWNKHLEVFFNYLNCVVKSLSIPDEFRQFPVQNIVIQYSFEVLFCRLAPIPEHGVWLDEFLWNLNQFFRFLIHRNWITTISTQKLVVVLGLVLLHLIIILACLCKASSNIDAWGRLTCWFCKIFIITIGFTINFKVWFW